MLTLISIVIPSTAALVVVAVARLMWRNRRHAADTAAAIAATIVLAGWGSLVALLALRGSFASLPVAGVPPVGIGLGAGLAGLAVVLSSFRPLGRLLGSQADLTRLHLWRLLGGAFVTMMILGRLPALFALPAGLGDIAIGATAPWMARRAARAADRRLLLWHTLGLADLIVAVALGVMTSPGVTQVFHTVPTSEAMTLFPLALVPTFLVPLAATLHGVALARLLRGAPRAEQTRVMHPAAIARH